MINAMEPICEKLRFIQQQTMPDSEVEKNLQDAYQNDIIVSKVGHIAHTDKCTHTHTHSTHTYINRHTQTHRHTQTQRERERGRHTHTHPHTHTHLHINTKT